MSLHAGMADSKTEAALAYCQAWLHRDGAALGGLLSPDIVVVECYGPEYRGLEEVEAWFAGFRGGVCLKWRFCCRWDGRESCFDGVSLMDFDEGGRISRIEEYSAKAEHIRPYRKEGKGDV